ncbi:MAG: dienelactone hydrolase family protein [Acidobacteria bacterium]|nr:dienelactone hydrolase family protein [Acidobacteriota bacterium]MBV9476082.1 dienelactone hydrolase family protein [Acidobacteriota bacterium]
MGQRVTFPSNGHTCQGYFASPESGSGPGVVVIQEWWGLVPHIEDLVERFAAAGFVAIAPDLYHGKTTKSPDDAMKLLMELDADRAETEIAGAGAYLLQQPGCTSKKVGVVGFCMGGALAQYAAVKSPGVFGAAVSFYGGFRKLEMPWENLAGPVLLIHGEKDKNVPYEQGRALAEKLREMGKDAEAIEYPNADHAFFNDARPEVYNADAAADAWQRTLALFRRAL